MGRKACPPHSASAQHHLYLLTIYRKGYFGRCNSYMGLKNCTYQISLFYTTLNGTTTLTIHFLQPACMWSSWWECISIRDCIPNLKSPCVQWYLFQESVFRIESLFLPSSLPQPNLSKHAWTLQWSAIPCQGRTTCGPQVYNRHAARKKIRCKGERM